MRDDLRKARLLRGAVGLAGPIEPNSDRWAAWVTLAMAERVVPLLYEIAAAGDTDLTAAQVGQAHAMQLDVAATMVRIEQSLVEVADLLSAGDVPFAVLKGNATAHIDYEDPSRRQFGDVDLLVRPEQLGRAAEMLKSAGWRQAYPLPRHHERFTHAITFRGSGLAEIDLHQHVSHRALGILVPTDQLLQRRIPFEIAGRSVSALSDADRLIHASLHAVSSRGSYRRLSGIADILLLTANTAALAEHTLDRAEGWRVRPIVERGIRVAHANALLPLPDPWSAAMAQRVVRRDRLVERAYLGEHRRPGTEELAHLRHIRSWSARVLYLYGHLRMDKGVGSGGLGSRIRYLRSRLRQRN